MQVHALLVTLLSAMCGLIKCQHLEWCDYYRRQGQINRPECVVQGTITPQVCQSRSNEIYMDCGSPCPATCTNLSPSCPGLAHNCVVNCFCSPGFVRDMNKPGSPCVAQQQCTTTQTCPAGEVYRSCGPACQPNCLDRNPVCQSNSCVAGCFCQDGLIRQSANGICVPVMQCANNQCPVNEVYQQCGSACPSTCQNRNPTCVQTCVAGCFCAPGFVRDMTNGRNSCVVPNMCSPSTTICSATERYMSCGTPCQPSCNNRNPVCQNYCVAGCFCQPGYVRNNENVCILPQFCPNTANKAGTCPPPTIFIGQSPLTIECSGDYDCSGSMKCCSEANGSRLCRYPAGTISTKAGQCPISFNSINAVSCFDDNSCPGSLKCCSDITGRKVCTDASVVQIVVCATMLCPIDFSCVNNQCMKVKPKTGCSTGTFQCGIGYTCMNNVCVYTGNGGTVISKANRVCPTNPPRNCQGEAIVISCNNDSDCDNGSKCCQATFCGGRICKEGVLVTGSTK